MRTTPNNYAMLAALLSIAALNATANDESRWESTIQRFEEQDAKKPPPKNAILFVGSSSIRMWDTESSFPGLRTINRGFGGSQIADSLQFAHRIVIPHKPRTIVFYAGDNDIAAGKSPTQVAQDYTRFVAKVRESLPEVSIIFVAIKPSLARWQLIKEIREANQEIREFSKTQDNLQYLDVDAPMIDSTGNPNPKLFLSDGLHLNAEGYALWNHLLRPYLDPR